MNMIIITMVMIILVIVIVTVIVTVIEISLLRHTRVVKPSLSLSLRRRDGATTIIVMLRGISSI